MKLFTPDSAHWYRRDGAPMHTVPAARGGGERSTTLRDARKLGLLPSVTNILGVIAKPELTAWLQEQAVLAALTLPRLDGESEDVFAQRVVADSRSRTQSATDFGSAFHHGAERVAQTLEVDPADPVAPWLNHYRDWFQANVVRVLWTERVLVNTALGYAGTADLLIDHQAHGLTLVDLKTQGVKVAPNGERKPTAYKSWCYQLAAYRKSLGQPVTCLNLIVDSKMACAPVEHRWSDVELEDGWRAFDAARTLWSIEKAFDPAALTVTAPEMQSFAE